MKMPERVKWGEPYIMKARETRQAHLKVSVMTDKNEECHDTAVCTDTSTGCFTYAER